jgi:hypothetical protein
MSVKENPSTARHWEASKISDTIPRGYGSADAAAMPATAWPLSSKAGFGVISCAFWDE